MGLWLLAAGLLTAGTGAAAWRWALSPPVTAGQAPTVEVTVPRGASTAAIAGQLARAGVIRHPLAFLLYVRYRGLDGRLRAGTYALSPAMGLPQIVDLLVEGRVVAERVTVPEGYTVRQVIELLVRNGLADAAGLRAALAERAGTWPYLPRTPLREPLEGYLFPDTYLFPRGAPPATLVDAMLRRFEEAFRPEWRARAAELGLTVHQVVTLASIVEREARLPEERPLIAAVYLNRLNRGMKLDADPTVLYALGRTSGTLTRQDLEVDSPYNTYRYPGLPPGPIANPGAAAIEAVLYPADVDYLYFVARPDGRGGHAFARTLEEHLRNVRRYRASR